MPFGSSYDGRSVVGKTALGTVSVTVLVLVNSNGSSNTTNNSSCISHSDSR